MQPHAGFDDWKVTQLPDGKTPGMECGDCNIDMCGEIRTRFWEVTFDANNGSETPWDMQHCRLKIMMIRCTPLNLRMSRPVRVIP